MSSIAAFIPARAGSKGLPGKNIIPFAGRPLIAWSIDAARATGVINDIYVSTDGDDIAEIAKVEGAEVLRRPEELATDSALPKDAIRHHVETLAARGSRPDIIVLLQPTSPLRSTEDILACIGEVKNGADSAVTFVKSPANPHRLWRLENKTPELFLENVDPWAPRQALPDAYAINGAVYAARTDVLLADESPSFIVGNAKGVVMPAERSVDIDTKLDLVIAEAIKNHVEK